LYSRCTTEHELWEQVSCLYDLPISFQSFSRSVPPEKGSFTFDVKGTPPPLTLEGKCTEAMKEYMNCLKEHAQNNAPCREVSMNYFKCRMDHGLMEREAFDQLGFKDLLDKKS
jgi:cytochrome c oxidase assembly protein subunit 19